MMAETGLPWLDCSVLDEHRHAVGGEVFLEVLAEFDYSGLGYREALDLALRDGRPEEARRMAHRLAGVAGMLGMKALQALCEEIEESHPTLSSKQLASARERLGRIYDETRAALCAYRRKV